MTLSGMRARNGVDPLINLTSGMVVDGAVRVHTHFGPGLLESTYHVCLVHELQKRGLQVASHVELPVHYDGVVIDVGYRLDLLVNDHVVVELKAVDVLHAVHEAQLLSYLKLSKRKVGLLINFNVVRLKDGIVRLVN